MEKTPMAIRNEKLGATVVKALQKRHFEAYYCETKEEAAQLALSLIPEGSSIAWGGAASVKEIGLYPMIRSGKFKLFDRDNAKSPEEKTEIMRQGLLADTFLMGANGISEDGQLFNVDATGNRVAGLMYGPKQVIVIAGLNKIAHTADDALTRARTIAAPINAARFNISTPCSVTGTCGNCTSTESICSQITWTRLCKPAGRIKVILVGEVLGY